MVRVKSAVTNKRRKKKVLKQAKGQFAQRSKRFRQAKRSIIKSMQYAYRDRKNRKRAFRSLWIARISAGCRDAGLSYSRFIKGLTTAKVAVNRKMLAELAATSPDVFRKLVDQAKGAIGG